MIDFYFSGDDRKRGNIAFCLSKLNIKTLASYRILQENFPNVAETNQQNEDDYDKEEHLAWKKYLMVNNFILKSNLLLENILFLACFE